MLLLLLCILFYISRFKDLYLSSSMSKKIMLDQNNLRRLMKEKALTASSSQKKIESAFARYNAAGQLWCTLCSREVKSSLLWNAHVLSRTHRELVKLDSGEGVSQSSVLNAPAKRKASNIDDVASVEKKRALDGNTALSTSPILSSSLSLSIAGSKVLCGSPIESDDDDEELSMNVSETSAAIRLPSEPFDASFSESNLQSINSLAEQLPEGFFDDPKMDAKVRQVPYRNKMEEEWELFQKSMKEEAMVSEALVEEDDDLREVERNIEEIDEQLCRWSRVTDLQRKREQFNTGLKTQQLGPDNVDSESDFDFSEFSDWRAGGK